MTTFRHRPGNVTLVRFPFTDLSKSKKRPAVVVSPERYHARHLDIVLVPITSKAQPEGEDLELRAWRTAGLLKPSWFKPVIATISATYALTTIGRLGAEDLETLANAMHTMVDESILLQPAVAK